MGLPLRSRRLARWLEGASAAAFAAFAIGAAFAAYFSMYAFRRPFAAASYSGQELWGWQLKSALIVSQTIGYTISKYLGIKVCSEAARHRRAPLLVGLIALAQATLFLFALAPPYLQAPAMLLNGLPLGMVWGLVVWYLEGRRSSEILLAGLSCSYILASGAVKDVGRALMQQLGVAEAWMPAAAGLCFLPIFLAAVWLLDHLPDPNRADVEARVEREPMLRARRSRFARQFLPGLAMLFAVYFFLSAYRDYRDQFGVEIFRALGFEGQPALFTMSESLVTLGVIVSLAFLNAIKDNRLGLLGAFVIMTTGAALLGGATLALEAGLIDGFWWMVLVGLGAYLAYVPYGSVLFDRLIASTRVAGTAVFAIYLADAIGYTGTVGVYIWKESAQRQASPLGFFKGFTWLLFVLGVALLAASCVYFLGKSRRAHSS
jgi:hypothetical protein